MSTPLTVSHMAVITVNANSSVVDVPTSNAIFRYVSCVYARSLGTLFVDSNGTGCVKLIVSL